MLEKVVKCYIMPLLRLSYILWGHKGQNSTGTQCYGFLVLDVVVFWSWNLDVVVFWSWYLDVVLYVPPRPRFRYPRENKKITHVVSCYVSHVNYVVEKYLLSKFMQYLSA